MYKFSLGTSRWEASNDGKDDEQWTLVQVWDAFDEELETHTVEASHIMDAISAAGLNVMALIELIYV